MDWYDVALFVRELRTLRGFLMDVASSEDLLSISGPRGIRKLSGYSDAIQVIPTLEARLLSCERIARFVDSELASRLARITQDSPLVTRSVELALAVELDSKRPRYLGLIGAARMFVNATGRSLGLQRTRSGFSDSEQIPVRRMLSDIDRMIPLLEQVEEVYSRRLLSDEEVFKPSNVNVEEVRVLIDKAIFQISLSPIDEKLRSNLESYLSEAKAELAKPEPSWKKVVGALVISSTILSGIAVAPDALSAINSAFKYIVGTSVQDLKPNTSFGPSTLPPPVEL